MLPNSLLKDPGTDIYVMQTLPLQIKPELASQRQPCISVPFRYYSNDETGDSCNFFRPEDCLLLFH